MAHVTDGYEPENSVFKKILPTIFYCIQNMMSYNPIAFSPILHPNNHMVKNGWQLVKNARQNFLSTRHLVLWYLLHWEWFSGWFLFRPKIDCCKALRYKAFGHEHLVFIIYWAIVIAIVWYFLNLQSLTYLCIAFIDRPFVLRKMPPTIFGTLP